MEDSYENNPLENSFLSLIVVLHNELYKYRMQ